MGLGAKKTLPNKVLNCSMLGKGENAGNLRISIFYHFWLYWIYAQNQSRLWSDIIIDSYFGYGYISFVQGLE
jgi:hypothetical protein